MSARPDFKGDYMGFSFGKKADGTPMHSSDLGIVRTSNGSRFDENLLPTMQDKTVQIPGGDGAYYFGSYYTQRQFSVSFAFDSLTEKQVADLKAHFGDKKIHDLIFDETPYKIYRAKVTGTATIKHLAFNEGKTNRLYKGEGTIQFTCYDPFARCWSTNRDDYKNHKAYEGLTDDAREARIDEWWDAARIVSNINFGDVPVPFKLEISGIGSRSVGDKSISWNLGNDVKAMLDTKTGVVLKKNNDGTISETLMNEYVTGDLTAKIPVGKHIEGAVYTCLYI